METFKKNIAWIIATLSTIGALYLFVFERGAQSQNTEGRIFDSPEQKVYTVKKVEEMPTPEQTQRQLILDSINTINAIKSRAKRDSLLIKMSEQLKHLDTLYLKTSDQVFQIKEELKNKRSQ